MQCPLDQHTTCHLQEEVSGEGKTSQSFRDDRRARLKHHPRDGQAEGTRRHEPGSLFPKLCQCLEQGLRPPFCWWEHWCLQFCYKLQENHLFLADVAIVHGRHQWQCRGGPLRLCSQTNLSSNPVPPTVWCCASYMLSSDFLTHEVEKDKNPSLLGD